MPVFLTFQARVCEYQVVQFSRMSLFGVGSPAEPHAQLPVSISTESVHVDAISLHSKQTCVTNKNLIKTCCALATRSLMFANKIVKQRDPSS